MALCSDGLEKPGYLSSVCMVLSNQGPMCLGTQPHKILSDNGPIFPRSYDGMVLHNQGPDKPGLSVPRVLSQQVMYIGC